MPEDVQSPHLVPWSPPSGITFIAALEATEKFRAVVGGFDHLEWAYNGAFFHLNSFLDSGGGGGGI